MISSAVFDVINPLFEIIKNAKGKTIAQIKAELNLEEKEMKKGASGLVIENLLGIPNNSRDEPDLPEIGCEVKALPLQKNKNGTIKAKEPTAIQTINYFEVARECWETAKVRKKINLTFWVVYLAQNNGKRLNQEDYIIIDCFLDHPNNIQNLVFKNDWESIKSFIVEGRADHLSCSMGEFIEPKTKGKNKNDVTEAPDGKGGSMYARRRAFYYKKKYTNTQIIPNLNLDIIK